MDHKAKILEVLSVGMDAPATSLDEFQISEEAVDHIPAGFVMAEEDEYDPMIIGENSDTEYWVVGSDGYFQFGFLFVKGS